MKKYLLFLLLTFAFTFFYGCDNSPTSLEIEEFTYIDSLAHDSLFPYSNLDGMEPLKWYQLHQNFPGNYDAELHAYGNQLYFSDEHFLSKVTIKNDSAIMSDSIITPYNVGQNYGAFTFISNSEAIFLGPKTSRNLKFDFNKKQMNIIDTYGEKPLISHSFGSAFNASENEIITFGGFGIETSTGNVAHTIKIYSDSLVYSQIEELDIDGRISALLNFDSKGFGYLVGGWYPDHGFYKYSSTLKKWELLNNEVEYGYTSANAGSSKLALNNEKNRAYIMVNSELQSYENKRLLLFSINLDNGEKKRIKIEIELPHMHRFGYSYLENENLLFVLSECFSSEESIYYQWKTSMFVCKLN